MSEYGLLTEKVTAELGLQARHSWPNDIKRAVKEVGSRNGLSTSQLLARIEHDKTLMRELAGYFTIGESHFFRHSSHFDYLGTFVENRLKKLGPRPALVIWSAGCSSGEEPYSVAIMLNERLTDKQNQSVNIVAADACESAIETARRAIYTAWSFRGAPAWLLPRYFRKRVTDGCCLSEKMRKAVTFNHATISEQLESFPNNSVDVIFFRNVGIYLTNDALTEAFKGYARVLSEGGLLIVAPADPRPPATLFTRVTHDSTSIYRVGGATADEYSTHKPFLRPEGIARKRETRVVTRPALRAPLASKRPKIHKPEVIDAASVNNREKSTLLAQNNRLKTLNQNADCGEVDKAIDMASGLIKTDPAGSAGYLLRGQLQLANMNMQEAIADLRSAVFVDANDKIIRFWYATALYTAEANQSALKQLAEIKRQLATLADDLVLEDGETSVDELREAANFLMESLE